MITNPLLLSQLLVWGTLYTLFVWLFCFFVFNDKNLILFWSGAFRDSAILPVLGGIGIPPSVVNLEPEIWTNLDLNFHSILNSWMTISVRQETIRNMICVNNLSYLSLSLPIWKRKMTILATWGWAPFLTQSSEVVSTSLVFLLPLTHFSLVRLYLNPLLPSLSFFLLSVKTEGPTSATYFFVPKMNDL